MTDEQKVEEVMEETVSLDECEKQLKTTQAVLEKMQSSHADLVVSYELVKRSLAKQEDACKRYEKEGLEIRTENKRLEREIETVRKEMETMVAETEKVKAKARSTMLRNEEIRVRPQVVEQLKQESEQQQKTMVSLRDQIEQQMNEIENLVRQRQELKQKLSDSEFRIKGLEKQLEKTSGAADGQPTKSNAL